MTDTTIIEPTPPTQAKLSQTLKDSNGEFSSKRVASAFCLANLALLTWWSFLSGKPVAIEILFMWATMACLCLGFTIPEWFAQPKRATGVQQ